MVTIYHSPAKGPASDNKKPLPGDRNSPVPKAEVEKYLAELQREVKQQPPLNLYGLTSLKVQVETQRGAFG
jgi:hypothetical protein